MRVLGVDPGISGAVAFLRLSGGLPVELEIIDMPIGRSGKRAQIDECALAGEIDARNKGEPFTFAIIEQGGVRPQNGRVGAASLWLGIGVLRGIFAANFIPIETVSPHVWKSRMRVIGDKDASRLRASAVLPRWAKLWPLKRDHGRAEAALIAVYGANHPPIGIARKIA